MTLFKHLAVLIAALAIAGSANALVITGATGNAVTDYSGAGLAAFDLDLTSFGPTEIDFLVEDADLLAPALALNAVVRNLSGAALSRLTFSLQGASFGVPGSVAATFGSIGAVEVSGHAVAIAFATPEFAQFHFGNPFSLAGATDWLLAPASLRAGDRFTLRATVPEPSTIALMLASLAMFAFAKRQRDKR